MSTTATCVTKPNQTTVWCDDLEEDGMRQVTVRGSLVRYSVFVCKMGCKITEEDLRQAIREFLVTNSWKCTEITTVKICKTKSGVSKGYGFIELNDDEACAALIDQKTLKIGSKEVTVSEAVRKHPEEMVLRKEHVELVSRNRRRNSISKSSDDNSERCQVPGSPYVETSTPPTNMMVNPVANCSALAPTSPVLVPAPQHHTIVQPSSLAMMNNQPAMMPSNRLMMPPCTVNSSSTMMCPSGMMAVSSMVTPAVMSPGPVASLQNMFPPEQNSALLTNPSPSIPQPLLYQGLSSPVLQNCALVLQTPRAPLYSPLYYPQYPQFQRVPNSLPRYDYQEPPFCYVTSM